MLAFGIVAGALDFMLAALLAEIAELLPRHAQRVVHLRRARARLGRTPAPSRRRAPPAAVFRRAAIPPGAGIPRFASASCSCSCTRQFLLRDQRRARAQADPKFLRHSRRNRFGAGEPFRERSHLRALRRQVFLFRLRVLSQCRLLFHGLRDLLFRLRARS